MEDLTGKQLGPYQIIASLGEGGMAAVYKAYHPAMERHVALKILPRHFASDPEFVNRFKQEARVLAQLQHPHIVPVFDFGAEDGYTYLVMPFIRSGTLAELLKGEPLPLEQILIIISQVGGALDYAHGHGVVHRDVKPRNVLIDESGHCLLTDFGLAKILEGSETLTHSGAILGTPAYMSPEQGLGESIDRQSDIYSLGVILYELATGRTPYRAETPMALMIKHISDPLPPPTRFNPMLSEAVESVILKALAKNPADRYQAAGLLVKALAAVPQESGPARQEVLTHVEPQKAEAVSLAQPVQQAMESQELPAAQTSISRSTVPVRNMILALVGILALFAAGLYLSQRETASRFDRVESTQTVVLTAEDVSAIQAPSTSAVSSPGDEQARAFAEPILNAIANRSPDFADDFSTDKGWRENGSPQGQTGTMEIRDGVLRFSNIVGQDGAELPGSPVWSSKDFVVQFETRLASGDRSSQQKLSFHNFSVGDQGYGYDVSIFSRDQLWVFNEFHSQKGLVAVAHGADNVHAIGETTQVMVIVRGDEAALYLDGNPMAYYQTSDLDNAGTTTFLCLGYAETTCEFDNVKFWDLNNILPSTSDGSLGLTPTGTASESFSNEQARAFAEPILKSIADRPPDFADDFATDKGWQEISGQRQAGKMEIRDGVLRFSNVVGQDAAEPPNSPIWSNKDFVVQFETRLVSGERSSFQKFVFHIFILPDHGYGYDVSIYSRDQSWVFNEFQNQNGTVAIAQGAGDVRPMGETTQVMVIVRGDHSALYLDGKPVAYYQTRDLDNPGTTSFACQAIAETTCEFDNVKFWDLSKLP